MVQVRVLLDEDTGEIRALNEPGVVPLLETLGQVRLERVSHIEPVGRVRRWWFRRLRRWFGDAGRAADWTRGWRGPWQVDFSPSGGVTHRADEQGRPFHTRDEAVAFELSRAWKLLMLGSAVMVAPATNRSGCDVGAVEEGGRGDSDR